MKNYETKEVTEKKKILKSVTCDNCSEEIDINREYFNLKVIESTGEWYWKDSETDEKQYCCMNCMLLDVVENNELFNSVAKDDFESMEIEKINKGK